MYVESKKAKLQETKSTVMITRDWKLGELRRHQSKGNLQLEDEYVALTKVNKKKMHEMMDRDTWFSAEEAVKLGFADKIIE